MWDGVGVGHLSKTGVMSLIEKSERRGVKNKIQLSQLKGLIGFSTMPESGNILSHKHEGAVEMEAFTGRVGQEKEVSSRE